MGKQSEQNSREVKIYYLYDNTTLLNQHELTREEAAMINYAYALNGTNKKMWEHVLDV